MTTGNTQSPSSQPAAISGGTRKAQEIHRLRSADRADSGRFPDAQLPGAADRRGADQQLCHRNAIHSRRSGPG